MKSGHGGAIALSAAMLGLLLFPTTSVGPALAAEDDTLVIARSTDFNSLDPSRSWCDSCQIYLSAVYEPLVRVGKDNKTLEPRLAKSWDIADGQRQFTFHLDPKAVFSDGSPVEAKDVKWSLERLKNVKEGPSFFVEGIQSIETPEAKTVVMTLEAPKLSAPYAVAMNSDVLIANGGFAGEGAESKDTAEAWLLKNSAGSGPFVLETYRPDDEVRLKRNEAYWGTKPALAGIVIREVKDAVAQSQMLESGGADIAMQIDSDTAETIKNPEVVTELVPSYNFVYVALSPGATRNKIPLSPKVREAFGYALDYEGILEFTVGGEGDLMATAIPNGFPGTEGLPMPKQDLEKAKQLLAEAGVPDGFELDAVYPEFNVYGVDLSTMMQKVQQDLAKVGIEAKLQPVTFAVWREQVGGEHIPLTAVFFAPDYFGSGQYTGYFSMVPGVRWYERAGGDKAEGLANARAQELLDKVRTAAPEEAVQVYHDLGMEMIKDRIIFPLVNPKLVLAYRKGVEGVRYAICCNLPLEELSKN
jgi:peptide/nickel transport system substrate-binding protein